MGDTVRVDELPLAPRNPLPYAKQVKAMRSFHTGCEELRNAGGPVTRCQLGPARMMPPIVVTTSPQGARDVLSRSFAMLEATLGLATIIRTVEVESLHDDFPVAVPFTTVADGPIMARVKPRT